MLPFTVLAGVPRLTGSTLVASISKALTGGGEPGRKKKPHRQEAGLQGRNTVHYQLNRVIQCDIPLLLWIDWKEIFQRRFHAFSGVSSIEYFEDWRNLNMKNLWICSRNVFTVLQCTVAFFFCFTKSWLEASEDTQSDDFSGEVNTRYFMSVGPKTEMDQTPEFMRQ